MVKFVSVGRAKKTPKIFVSKLITPSRQPAHETLRKPARTSRQPAWTSRQTAMKACFQNHCGLPRGLCGFPQSLMCGSPRGPKSILRTILAKGYRLEKVHHHRGSGDKYKLWGGRRGDRSTYFIPFFILQKSGKIKVKGQ